MPTLKFGAQPWSQASDWPNFHDAAVTADRVGWDSIWTWDHLLAIQGPWEQPIFEGWMALAGLAPVTERARLGLMVGANTLRNPGLTAKMAITLDHISGGRAIIGIGGAWFQREHEAFGFEFGRSPGERLAWLDEAVGLMRRLLDGERVTHDGPHYRMVDALCLPGPVQAHLPILIGGSGEQKTLRTVARHADAWNMGGTVEAVARKAAILEEHCAAVGRDPATIERTFGFPMVIRDSIVEARQALDAIVAHNRMAPFDATTTVLLGPPEAIADQLRPYLPFGLATVIVRMPAPYDRETIHRMPELRELLARD